MTHAIPRPIWPAPITAALFIGANAAILSLVCMVDADDVYREPNHVEPRQGPSGNLMTGKVRIIVTHQYGNGIQSDVLHSTALL